MSVPFEGGCHCGAVRYVSRAEPLNTAHCHCRDCQRTVGGAFATILFVPDDAVSFRGEARGYTVSGESGATVTRFFCPQCGSPVFSRASAVPGMVFLKAGSLDDPSWVEPSMQFWTESAQPWCRIGESLAGFPKNPPLG